MEDYKVIRAIGKGSFGKVYLVRHVAENKQYVMKVIKLKGIPPKEKDACRNEVMLMQRLQHPNIVAYKDSFFANGRDNLCIVMTYCDGGDLGARVAEAKGTLIKEDQIMHWFVQMTLAIHYMHQNNVLHRDIKAQNIFLLGNGRLVLGDLGISKVLDGTMAFAKTQIGTPYYMSPELFRSAPYNHKSDVWALGCVLYELCTLSHPFDATSLHALASKIMTGKYAPINPKYSQSLRALIASMLSLSSEKRPSTKEILQQPYIQKHVFNFIRDIVERSAVPISPPLGLAPDAPLVGDGTMMFRAAALKVGGGGSTAAGTDAMAKAIAAGLGPHANNLQQQLVELGMQPLIARALSELAPTPSSAVPSTGPIASSAGVYRPAPIVAPPTGGSTPAAVVAPSVPTLSPKAAKKMVKESQAALDREEERKRAVESALARLREEKDLRAKQREDFRKKQERMLVRQVDAKPVVPPTSGAAAVVQAPVRSAVNQVIAAPASFIKPVRVPVGVHASAVSAAASNNKAAVKIPAGAAGISGISGVKAVAVAPSPKATPVVSAASAADARALQFGVKAPLVAARKDLVAPASDNSRKPRSISSGGSTPVPAVPEISGPGLAARRAEAEKKRVAELEQWEREKAARAHAQAVNVSALRAANDVNEAAKQRDGVRVKDRSDSTASTKSAVTPVPAGRSVSVGSRDDERHSVFSSASSVSVGKPSVSLASPAGVPGLPPRMRREPSLPVFDGEKPVDTPATRGPSPSHARQPTPTSSIPASPTASSPTAGMPAAVKLARQASGERLPVDPSPPLDAPTQAELDCYLPSDFEMLSARDKVLARSRAIRKFEEERQRAALQAAVVENVVDRKRAQVQQREQYRGVGAAIAGALPIHATVLEKSVADASDLVVTLQSQLPGARYDTSSVHDESKSAGASESKCEPIHEEDLVDDAAGGDGDEGYQMGELPDSDSEDSVILEAATHNERSEGVVPAARRIGLDSGAEDEMEIREQESRLREELQRSTMRCTGLRASLEVARKVAADVGVPLHRDRNVSRPSSALPLASSSMTVPIEYAPEDGAVAPTDNRPIRPSQNPRIFGTTQLPQPGGPRVESSAQRPNSTIYSTVQEEDEDYDDEDDLGDEDGNEEGGISFKNLPLDGHDELVGGSEWHQADAGDSLQPAAPEFKALSVSESPEFGVFHTFHVGSLSDRVEHYRAACRTGLGEAVYYNLYVQLKRRLYGDEDDSSSGMAVDTTDLAALLPAEKQGYLEHMETLINMEEQLL